MTFPCKEQLIEFSNLQARQHQIYEDASDIGINFCEVDLPKYRLLLNDMLKVFKAPRYNYRADKWNGGSSVSFNIPIEMDEGAERGITFRVTACKDKKVAGGGFMTIDMYNY